eukprot:SAG31_NODE_272_length_18690_cov_14.520785_4_plen_129_part_00
MGPVLAARDVGVYRSDGARGPSFPRRQRGSGDDASTGERVRERKRESRQPGPTTAGRGDVCCGVLLRMRMQIEQYYGDDGKKYAQWCADLVGGMRPGVPIAMCQQQGVEGVIETCNGFYCDPHDKSIR